MRILCADALASIFLYKSISAKVNNILRAFFSTWPRYARACIWTQCANEGKEINRANRTYHSIRLECNRLPATAFWRRPLVHFILTKEFEPIAHHFADDCLLIFVMVLLLVFFLPFGFLVCVCFVSSLLAGCSLFFVLSHGLIAKPIKLYLTISLNIIRLLCVYGSNAQHGQFVWSPIEYNACKIYTI